MVRTETKACCSIRRAPGRLRWVCTERKACSYIIRTLGGPRQVRSQRKACSSISTASGRPRQVGAETKVCSSISKALGRPGYVCVTGQPFSFLLSLYFTHNSVLFCSAFPLLLALSFKFPQSQFAVQPVLLCLSALNFNPSTL